MAASSKAACQCLDQNEQRTHRKKDAYSLQVPALRVLCRPWTPWMDPEGEGQGPGWFLRKVSPKSLSWSLPGPRLQHVFLTLAPWLCLPRSWEQGCCCLPSSSAPPSLPSGLCFPPPGPPNTACTGGRGSWWEGDDKDGVPFTLQLLPDLPHPPLPLHVTPRHHGTVSSFVCQPLDRKRHEVRQGLDHFSVHFGTCEQCLEQSLARSRSTINIFVTNE